MWRRLAYLISALIMSAVALPAVAQVTCITQYASSTGNKGLGFVPSEVEALVAQSANAIGLSPSGIHVVPCDGISKAVSNYIADPGVPKGDYIFYDPVWAREMLGDHISKTPGTPSRDEAVFLFGHELGHLLGRHFTSNSNLPRINQEADADRFAGCAAGALGAKWANIESFISRIRGDTPSTYPSRAQSLAVAKPMFIRCTHDTVAADTPASGWVFAGYVDQNDPTRWTSEPRVTIVKQSGGHDRPFLVRVGDTVAAQQDLHQVITDYRTKGTLNQLTPPWSLHGVTITKDDWTGRVYPAKSNLEVLDVSEGQFPGRDFAVWLRVSPVDK